MYGIDPKHLTISHNYWTFITWNKDEVPYLAENNNKLLHYLDKLVSELQNTDRQTTARPSQIQLINGLAFPKILSYQDKLANILTKPGMEEMGMWLFLR